MTTPQFDTLRAAKTLKRGGFDQTQAETVVNTLDQAVNENLSTKTDLNLLRSDVKQGFTDANAATEKATTEAKAATDKLRSDTNQGFTEANAAAKQGFADAKAATDELRSDTKQGFTKSEATTDKLRSTIEKGFAEANAATEKAFTKSEAANEKRFATLYRYLLGVGATLVVIMITLFLAN